MARLDLPALTTRDCKLRPWTLEDAAAFREACGDADICRFTTVPILYSEDAVVQRIERQHGHATAGTAIVLAIIPASDLEPVGMIGLFGLDRPEQVPSLRLLADRVGAWPGSRQARRSSTG
jgi:RimJ/RimL family protein N-acetyltransferase